MRRFETHVSSVQSEVFNTAVFRFLETNNHDPVREFIMIDSEPDDGGTLKSVTLWSDEAAEQFGKYWATYPKRARLGPV